VFITLCDKAGYPRFTLGAANVDEAYRKVWAALMGLVHKHLRRQNTEHMGLLLLDGDDPDMVGAAFSDARLRSTTIRVLATRGAAATAAVTHAVHTGPGSAGSTALVPAAAPAANSDFGILPAAVGASAAAAASHPAAVGASAAAAAARPAAVGASAAAAAARPAAVGASAAVAAHRAAVGNQGAAADGLAASTAASAAADLPDGAETPASPAPTPASAVAAAALASAAAAAAASDLGYLDAAGDGGSTADISDEDTFLDGAEDDLLDGSDSGGDAVEAGPGSQQ